MYSISWEKVNIYENLGRKSSKVSLFHIMLYRGDGGVVIEEKKKKNCVLKQSDLFLSFLISFPFHSDSRRLVCFIAADGDFTIYSPLMVKSCRSSSTELVMPCTTTAMQLWPIFLFYIFYILPHQLAAFSYSAPSAIVSNLLFFCQPSADMPLFFSESFVHKTGKKACGYARYIINTTYRASAGQPQQQQKRARRER